MKRKSIAVVASLTVLTLVAMAVLIVYLFGRVEQLTAERDAERARKEACLAEQLGMRTNFERTVEFLTERCETNENQLHAQLDECRSQLR